MYYHVCTVVYIQMHSIYISDHIERCTVKDVYSSEYTQLDLALNIAFCSRSFQFLLRSHAYCFTAETVPVIPLCAFNCLAAAVKYVVHKCSRGISPEDSFNFSFIGT